MTSEELLSWLSLFKVALAISAVVYEGVQNLAQQQLTPEELASLELAWAEDVRRSAANAGIPFDPSDPNVL